MVHQHLISNAKLLRADPTRTTGIVRRFVADLRRRARKLIVAVSVFLDTEDELGLKEHTTLIRMARRTFAFRSDADKLKAFNEWFAQQVQLNVLSVPVGTDPSRPWTAQYVESAYKRGLLNAYFSTKAGRELGEFEQNQISFLRAAFTSPEAVSKMRLLATRSFEDLKGVTAQMSASMSRILANGMAEGRNPRDIATTMRQNLAKLTQQRAELIARTEVIHAHADAQLDAFTKLGVKELGIQAELSTAGDDRVCSQCAALEGAVYPIEEARNIIPVHPLCRCNWTPVTEP